MAVMVGRPISVGRLDSNCLTVEPVCSYGCLPFEVKGPAAEATTAAAAVEQKLWLQMTRQAAEQAAAVWTEVVGQWAAV